MISAAEGNTTNHQAPEPVTATRPPSAAICPHAGVGGATPNPRNDSAASRMMAPPITRVVLTMIGLRALGRM